MVHAGDVLEFDFAALRGAGARLRVCGNLPYNISTPLLFHLLASRDAIADMHFMLQKEVVDRIVAPPGGKEYGRLTVMLAAACVGHLAVPRRPRRIPAAAGGRLRGRAPRPARGGPVSAAGPGRFARVVAAAFSMRRKTLRNSLRGLVDEAGFDAAGDRRRPAPGDARPRRVRAPRGAIMAAR